LSGGAFNDGIPRPGNAVRAVDLPALSGNMRVLAEVVSSVQRGGPSAPAGWITGVTLDTPAGSARTSTSGAIVFHANAASGLEAKAHDGFGYQRFASTRRVSGAVFLQVEQAPVSGMDVANRAWVESALSGAAVQALDDIGDVDAEFVNDGETILWNTDHWETGLQTLSLGDLSDVAAGVADGDIIKFNGATWEPEQNELARLEDVDTSAAVSGDVLQFEDPLWVAGPLKIGGFPVVIAGLASGDILRFNGTEWVNVPADS
jgi:hypothetical protein